MDVDLWLLGGQSNAQGTPPAAGNKWQGGKLAPTLKGDAVGLAFEWEDGFGVIPLADNRTTGWAGQKYKAQPGSAWPAFFNYYCRYTPNKQVLVRGAIGGTSVLFENTYPQDGKGDWDTDNPDGDRRRFDALIDRAEDAISEIEGDGDTIISCNVLWHGGERDALMGNGLGSPLGDFATSEFFEEFKALLTRFRTDMTPSLGSPIADAIKMYVVRIGRPEYMGLAAAYADVDDELLAVREFQDQACIDVDGMEMAYTGCLSFATLDIDSPSDPYGEFYGQPSYMSQKDHIHYSQDGYNKMGEAVANFVVVEQGLSEISPPEPEIVVSPLAHRLLDLPAV